MWRRDADEFHRKERIAKDYSRGAPRLRSSPALRARRPVAGLRPKLKPPYALDEKIGQGVNQHNVRPVLAMLTDTVQQS